jgi:DNA-binding CsgD family transcriptional regulator/tetratricopeptide (TPR) repeat protein
MPLATRVSSPTLVGRCDELRALRDLLQGVKAGGSGCAVLVGEAGVGKTRLVQELARSADTVEVLVGGSVEVGPDVLPYAPFVEVLSDVAERYGVERLRGLAGPTADELARLLPAVGGGLVPDLTRASGSRLYAALRSLVAGLAAERPLLVVVEDLHWADAGTRDLLGLLARRLPPQVLLVLTARSDEVEQPRAVPRFVAQLVAAGAVRVELGRLSREEQALQLSGILGVPPTPSRVEHVYARAEGNPFFAEEIMALGGADVVPVTVRDLLKARLDALPSGSRRAVRAAAAAGRRVEHGLLAAVLDLDEGALDDALRPAVERHVLVADGGGYAFRHALLHETVSATLLPGERVRLHRRLAEALDEDPALAGSRHGLAARLAHHWLAAGDLDRGRQASYEAACEAERTLAFEEARSHYERVLALPEVEGQLPVRRYRLLWLAAEAAHLSASATRATELVQQAIDCIDPDERHHHAYLHERLGRYLWMAADGAGALASDQRAVELVPQEPVSCWQAAITSGYSQVLMLSGRFREARVEAERAIGLCGQIPNGRSTEGHARNNLGVALVHLGDVDGGIAQLRLARRIADEEYDDVDDIARAIVNLFSVLFDVGRFEQALQVARDGIGVIDHLGLQRRKGVWCRCDAVEALLVLGRHDEAAVLLEEAVALDAGGIDALRTHQVRGVLALRRGRLEEAERELELAHRLGPGVTDGHLVLPLQQARVELRRWCGQPDEALAVADEVRSAGWEEGDASYLLPVLATAAGAAADGAVRARTGRRPAEATRLVGVAADLLAEAEGSLRPLPAVLPPVAAALAVARAEAARASGAGDGAEWAEVAGRWQLLGDRGQQAYALLREAECQLAARRRGRAAAALAEAARIATELGAEHLLAALGALAARARLPLQTRVEGPSDRFHLSPRERDVLALVARGRTDRQIGAELFISHRTVERHVSNILAKLDARTRAEVAAIAHRVGLVGAG